MTKSTSFNFVISSADLMSLSLQVVDMLRGEGDKNFILTDDLLDMGRLLASLKKIVTHNYPF